MIGSRCSRVIRVWVFMSPSHPYCPPIVPSGTRIVTVRRAFTGRPRRPDQDVVAFLQAPLFRVLRVHVDRQTVLDLHEVGLVLTGLRVGDVGLSGPVDEAEVRFLRQRASWA